MSLSRRLRRQAERQAIKGVIDIEKLREDGRYRMTIVQFERLLAKLSSGQQKLLLSNPLPNDYSQIRQISTSYEARFENVSINLQWYVKTIKPYASSIKAFLRLKMLYERDLLKGAYNEALAQLNIINETICYSQWAIEQTLLINEYKNGLKGNKQALQAIAGNVDGAVRLVAYLQSIRVEKNLPLFQYNDILSKVYEGMAEPERRYFSYKAAFFGEQQFNWSLLLWAESTSSLIDRYCLFQEAISLLACSKSLDVGLVDELTEAVTDMTSLTDDALLYNTILSLGGAEVNQIMIESSTTTSYIGYDLYMQGLFEQAATYCLRIIEEQPELIDLYEIYVLSLLNIEQALINPFSDGSIAHTILSILYGLFAKGDQVEQALTDLLKLCYSLGSSNPISFKLFAIFSKHYSYVERDVDRQKLAALRSVRGNATLGFFTNNVHQGFRLIESNPLISTSTTVRFEGNYLRQLHGFPIAYPVEVEPFQLAMIEANVLAYRGRPDEAVGLYDLILGNTQFSDRLRVKHNLEHIVHRKLLCFLQLKDFASSIHLVAMSNLENPGFFSRLGYEVLIDHAIKADDDLITSSIVTPVLLSQYAIRYRVSTNSLWTAYDNFMFNAGVRMPSELRQHIPLFSRDCLIYFLKHVCVQDILGLSYNDFENEDDLDNERMAVLAVLCEIDYKNYEEYVEEIQTLSSNIEIRKGIKQLDESKIYVDVAGIRTALEKDLKESFNRSLELDSLNMPGLEKLLERLGVSISVFRVDEDTNKLKVITKTSQEIASNIESRYQSFTTAFQKIRDMFVTNSDFGLDSYISMRIRHGALLGQIRSIFDGFGLVTRRRDDTDEYMDNVYWTERLELFDPVVLREVNDSFARFSARVDQHSEELKNRWIQLNTEQKPTDGLFNYVYSDRELSQLYDTKFDVVRSYDEFFDLVVDELWLRTEKNLRMIREHVLTETQTKIIDALEELSRYLAVQLKDQDSTELIRSVTECKTQFRYEMEKIANWFRRSNNTTINDFRVELPIKASLTTVRKMHHSYNGFLPEQQIHSSSVFVGRYFAQFSDLFRNLFDNILTHAGLSEDELQVTLLVVEADGQLQITVENTISTAIDLNQLNKKVSAIKVMLANPSVIDRTRSEGGTGYPKIDKLLRSDLGRKNYAIQIEPVTKDRLFKITVRFETKGLTTG